VGLQEEEDSEGTMLDRSTCVASPDIESSRFSPRGYDHEDFSLPEPTDSIMGKLKTIFPTLFHSLTSWEINVLDESSFFGLRKDPLAPPVNSCSPSVSRDMLGVTPDALPTDGLVGRGFLIGDHSATCLACNNLSKEVTNC
jgi:hypothetical protein